MLLSLDNGCKFGTAEDWERWEPGLIDRIWGYLVNYMEDEARKQVHSELAPCSHLEFLERYLEICKYDLMIG